jgi:hypothetical protein
MRRDDDDYRPGTVPGRRNLKKNPTEETRRCTD